MQFPSVDFGIGSDDSVANLTLPRLSLDFPQVVHLYLVHVHRRLLVVLGDSISSFPHFLSDNRHELASVQTVPNMWSL